MSGPRVGLNVVPVPGSSRAGSYIATQDGSTSQIFNGYVPAGIQTLLTPWYWQPYQPDNQYISFTLSSIQGNFAILVVTPEMNQVYTPIRPDADGNFYYNTGQPLGGSVLQNDALQGATPDLQGSSGLQTWQIVLIVVAVFIVVITAIVLYIRYSNRKTEAELNAMTDWDQKYQDILTGNRKIADYYVAAQTGEYRPAYTYIG